MINKSTAIFAACLLGVWLATSSLFAEVFPSYEEIWRKSQQFRERPSFSTELLDITMASVTYRIPRNYLAVTGDLSVLRLTWPGLVGLSEETRKCFGSILQSEKAGCTSIRFMLHGPGLKSAQRFKNFIKGLNVTQKEGPLGYQLYLVGPPEALIESYVKEFENRFVFFQCMVGRTSDNRDATVCDDWFDLDDGNTVHFFFRKAQIEHITEIEDRFRRMIEGFRTKERRRD